MDLIIPDAFAEEKLEEVIALWSPRYETYVKGLDKDETPLDRRDYALENVREFLTNATSKKARAAAIKDVEFFTPH